jgi:Protein of unknown function (DUF2510)
MIGLPEFFIIWLVLGPLVGGGIGYAIGLPKGRAALGFVLGMFGGVIGWIVIAILDPTPAEMERRAAQSTAEPSTSNAPERVCPWCAETIKAAAIVCRFCNRAVEPVVAAVLPPPVLVEGPIPDDRWLPDPLGRAPERLWNGSRWTAHVRDHAGAHWSDDDPALASLDTPTELRPV